MQGEAERALRCRPPSFPRRLHFDADSIDSAIPGVSQQRQRHDELLSAVGVERAFTGGAAIDLDRRVSHAEAARHQLVCCSEDVVLPLGINAGQVRGQGHEAARDRPDVQVVPFDTSGIARRAARTSSTLICPGAPSINTATVCRISDHDE